jgi:hypothetical protein
LLLYERTGFRVEVWKKFVEVCINPFNLVGVHKWPSILTTDSVTSPTVDAFKLRFPQIGDEVFIFHSGILGKRTR